MSEAEVQSLLARCWGKADPEVTREASHYTVLDHSLDVAACCSSFPTATPCCVGKLPSCVRFPVRVVRTPVGVSRGARGNTRRTNRRPHARGGEPALAVVDHASPDSGERPSFSHPCCWNRQASRIMLGRLGPTLDAGSNLRHKL
jgi:hypothetical protein